MNTAHTLGMTRSFKVFPARNNIGEGVTRIVSASYAVNKTMANSRLEKIGTIYSRITGLLRSGAMKIDDKPIWYNIYQTFPPKYNPKFDRPAPNIEVQEIFYEEDQVRAKIHKHFSQIIGSVHLGDTTRRTNTQQCLEKYNELIRQNISPDEALKVVTEDISSNLSLKFEDKYKDSRPNTNNNRTLADQFKQAQAEKINMESIFKD